MARFSVLIFALALASAVSSADGWAHDKYLGFTTYANETCGYYLDAYSRTTLRGNTYSGPAEAWLVIGWIGGYLTAYNEFNANGKKSILGGMSQNDARRWIAAWCRDNPSKDVLDAVSALTGKLER